MPYTSTEILFVDITIFIVHFRCINTGCQMNGTLSTNASSQRLASMKDCSKVLPPSTKRDWRLRSYRTCMIWGNISCPKFIGRYSTPGRELWGCSVNTSVGTLPSNKWSVGDRLSLRSMTRRTGERPYQLRTLREGLSSSAVRVPTSMAACSARFYVPSWKSTEWIG